MLITSLIGAAGALGSAIYGAAKSSKANNQARALIQSQRDDNRRWYDTKMNQDYTLRADVQNALNRQRELLDEQMKRVNANKVVGGASDESVALAKDSANKAVADAAADIAAAGAQYKDNVEQQYRAQDAALNQQQAQSYQNQAAEASKAAAQGVNAGLNLVGIGAQDAQIGQNRADREATMKAAMRSPLDNAIKQPTYTSSALAKSQEKLTSPVAIPDDKRVTKANS